MRKRWSIFLLVPLMLLLGGVAGRVESQDVPRMPVEELRAKLDDPQVVIIDVRSGHDWNASQKKIAGAVREEPATLDWAEQYDRNKTLVLYCA